MTEPQQKLVEKLKQRDTEVRAHEQAHLAAAGGLARGAPSFTYQYGPDGRAYAIGGEVSIDTSPGSTPQETIRKAEQIRAAALAPAEPSSQDRAVAAEAAHLEQQAQQELARSGSATDGGHNANDPSTDASKNDPTALYRAVASANLPEVRVHVSA